MTVLESGHGQWLWRGFPPAIDGLPLDQVGAQGWRLADLTTPVALLAESALVHNQTALDDWAARRGALLAPHAKTTMSPELIRLQLGAGSWAVTAANPMQATIMVASGASRVIIANEVASALALADLLGTAEVWVFVDSPEAVAVVAEAGLRSRTTVPVILDIGFPGGRTGVRTESQALDVVDAVRASSQVELAGYGLFEGILATGRAASDLATVRSGLKTAVALASAVQDRFGVPEPIVTGGGSMFPDLVADVLGEAAVRWGGRLVLRPGCYLVHDHGSYAASYDQAPWLDLRPALSVLATVISVPEPGLALLDAGKRDLTLDGRTAPVLEITRGDERVQHPPLIISRSNDQHSFVDWTPGSWPGFRVGDRVRLGISHPCLTFQLWRALPLVDDTGNVTGVARTFF
jgi:D-serine dehydratase